MIQFLIILFIALAILSIVLDMIIALAPIVIVGAIVIYLYHRFGKGKVS